MRFGSSATDSSTAPAMVIALAYGALLGIVLLSSGPVSVSCGFVFALLATILVIGAAMTLTLMKM